jgi:hypothetical protein
VDEEITMYEKMERRKILITTKTYPSISKKYREIVCTAGILLDDDENPLGWIRLYPVKFRSLEFGQRYKKFHIISVNIIKNQKDNRPESYRPEEESVEVLKEISTVNKWEQRKKLILPFQFTSTSEILDQGKSLGIIKPRKILKTYYEKDDREWSEDKLAVLDQFELFEKESVPTALEKIPYKFGYEFIDEDDKKHQFSVIDWEIGQLYRNCRDASQQPTPAQREAEAVQKVIQKLEKLRESDLHFIVGNQQRFQKSFMIISLFYPPVVEYEQMSFL